MSMGHTAKMALLGVPLAATIWAGLGVGNHGLPNVVDAARPVNVRKSVQGQAKSVHRRA